VAVRDFCTWAFRGEGGALAKKESASAWIPGRARQGRLVHQRLQTEASSEQGCGIEVFLKYAGRHQDLDFRLSGRADIVRASGRVEEVKTVLLSEKAFAQLKQGSYPAHEMQALLYAWMLHKGQTVRADLRLVNLSTGNERLIQLKRPAAEIVQFIDTQVTLLQTAHTQICAEAKGRKAKGKALRFPFDSYRPRQRTMIQDVQNAMQREQILMLNAPTGLGKSIGVLLPALRTAFATGRRVFFATAKNTGRKAAFQVLEALAKKGCEVSCVAMSAREGLCLADVYFCQEASCAFLRGMEKRLPKALKSLEKRAVVDRAELMQAGMDCEVCPHELALALCETRDLVVGDYNYALDPRIRIRRLFVEGDPKDFVMVVDEAHNLAPRARDWFSSSLSMQELEEMRDELGRRQMTGGLFHGGDALDAALKGMHKVVLALIVFMQDWESMLSEDFQFARDASEMCFGAHFHQDEMQRLQSNYERHVLQFILRTVLQGVAEGKDPVIDFHYKLERFTQLASRREPSMRQVIRLNPTTGTHLFFEVICTWAGDWLHENLQKMASTVLLSATLKPWDWHGSELGLQKLDRLEQLSVPSSFPPENRCLLLHEGLSSRYRERRESMGSLAQLVHNSFLAVGGNTAVFLPSFAYLRELRKALPKRLPLLVHDGTMPPNLRSALLKRLSTGGPYLLLTVMGGIFAEAVDFPGRMLESALVVGPGLPGVSHERELAKAFYESRGEEGFHKAYRLPGLCRVLQAAGRVIRRPEDRGSIVLIDDRFKSWENLSVIEESYEATPHILQSNQEVVEALRDFHGTPGASESGSDTQSKSKT
jgi:DNA excision repair protein ERCC-2